MSCYASSLGNCSGGFSAEHYISESVLKLAGNIIRVSGFPWLPEGESHEIGIGSLKSNILCQRHNRELSSLDSEAKKFVFALKSSFNQSTKDGKLAGETYSINGDLLERWFLKVICGIIVMLKLGEIPRLWIDILFNDQPFPRGSGMYLFGELGRAIWQFNLLRVIFVPNKEGMIAGAKFGIGGIPITLGFGRPDFEDPAISSFYRPSIIEFRYGSGVNQICFTSESFQGNGTVFLNIEERIDLRNDNNGVTPMVSKDH